MKRRIIGSLLVVITLFTLSANARAIDGLSPNAAFVPATIDTSKINVILNGTEVAFDVNPVYTDGRTLVPFRPIMEALDLKVEWVGTTNSVIAKNDTTKITLSIGSTLAYVNSKPYTLDVAPVVSHGCTLVPIRFISESVNMDVQWNSVASVVFINDRDSYKQQTYSNGQVSYIGQVDSENQRCGFGTSYAQDGSKIYTGQWLSDEEFGIGTYTWKNKITYQGECKNGEAWGYGKMTYPDDGYYIGYFEDGKRNGIGTYTWYVGDKYVGSWFNDTMSGEGTYTFADGYTIKGTWDENAIKIQNPQ